MCLKVLRVLLGAVTVKSETVTSMGEHGDKIFDCIILRLHRLRSVWFLISCGLTKH
jgi:hypothetical protein